ncbi:hypothetical protein [Nocardia callitridis]|uniref:Uncharacterized protein n=1 Tax=Nocardia callitridis TaxID=648753 RepID=A0ABP9K351_9NOCA
MRATLGTSTMPAPSRPRRLDLVDADRPVRTDRSLTVRALLAAAALVTTSTLATSTLGGAIPQASQ